MKREISVLLYNAVFQVLRKVHIRCSINICWMNAQMNEYKKYSNSPMHLIFSQFFSRISFCTFNNYSCWSCMLSFKAALECMWHAVRNERHHLERKKNGISFSILDFTNHQNKTIHRGSRFTLFQISYVNKRKLGSFEVTSLSTDIHITKGLYQKL